MAKSGKKLLPLPLDWDIETRPILKSLPSAHAAVAELKGIASAMPNQSILINTLGLQEAKDSSAIENIITTHDDLYKSELNLDLYKSLNAKEVQNYIAATKTGFDLISKSGLLTNRVILKIQEILEGNNAGFRKLSGTAL
jgi:Fic family protein